MGTAGVVPMIGSQQAGGVNKAPAIGLTPASIPGLPTNVNPLVPGAPASIAPLPTQAAASPTIGGAVPTSPVANISQGVNTADGSYTLTGDFKDTYGAGTGAALTGVLGGLGTATDAAVQATNAATNFEATKQDANITSSLAAHGVSADSSTAALEHGDFWSGVNTSEQATTAQMELGEENTLINALQTEGKAHGPDVSALSEIGDVLSGGLDTIGSIAGAVDTIPGTGGTSIGTILDTLSEL